MDPAQQDKFQINKTREEAKFDEDFLKGEKDENIGVYCDLFSAKSNFKGQDGGIVTSLLAEGLKAGVFEAAIVCRGQGYSAEAKIANSASEVLAAAGTKYLKVNVTKKLRELIGKEKKKIAVVCTPCEAKAVRKIQQTLKNKCEITVIGLFCFEAFNKDKLKKETASRLGIDIEKAQKTQVRQGNFSAFLDGKEYKCRLKDLDGASEKACHFCDDFTAQFADISVGSVGSKEGYSSVIVRSKVGENLVKNLKATEKVVDKEEICRLAKFKKTRARNNFGALNKSN